MQIGISKVILFFNDGSFGWSESYYDATGNVLPTNTLPRALTLAGKRANMLACGAAPCPGAPCSQPQLVAIRVSTVGVPRQTIFTNPYGQFLTAGQFNATFPTSAACSTTTGIGQDGPPDNPYSAMEMICFLDSGTQSKRSISGVPDSVICDQSWNRGSAFAAAAQVFAAELTNGNWGALSNFPQASKLVPSGGQQIVSLGYNTGPSASPPNVQLWPAQDDFGHPYIRLHDPISFNGTNQPSSCNFKLYVWGYVPVLPTPSINGVYHAFPVITPTGPGPNSFDTFLLKKKFSGLSFFCPGWAAPVNYNVEKFVNVLMDRPTKRDRGRPFGLRAGRSKVRH